MSVDGQLNTCLLSPRLSAGASRRSGAKVEARSRGIVGPWRLARVRSAIRGAEPASTAGPTLRFSRGAYRALSELQDGPTAAKAC
jgi:hypothetical protein